jgi:2-polyprenyl-3-methyl-5-hydroxy-6-metoxy-1,4-benzoquinol methylase
MMKKYILSTLCVLNTLHSMEHSSEKIEITKRVRKSDYNAEIGDKANIIAENSFLECLQDCNIDTKNKIILDMSCRTGNIGAKLANTATQVHGLNDNKNKINFAQNKHRDIKNLSFEHIRTKETKNFKSTKQYDIAIAPFCINHWRKHTKEILCTINKNLKMNGDFFATLSTTDNPKVFTYVAGEKLIQNHISHNFSLEKLTNFSFLSYEELIKLLRKTGFKLIALKEHSYRESIDKDTLAKEAKCIAEGTPLANYIPDSSIKKYLDEYVNLLIEQASSIDKSKNEYTFDVFFTMLHAHKIKDLS